MIKWILISFLLLLSVALTSACVVTPSSDAFCESPSTKFELTRGHSRSELHLYLTNETNEEIRILWGDLHFTTINLKAHRLDNGKEIDMTPALVGLPPGSFVLQPKETRVMDYDLNWIFPDLENQLMKSDVKIEFSAEISPDTINDNSSMCVTNMNIGGATSIHVER